MPPIEDPYYPERRTDTKQQQQELEAISRYLKEHWVISGLTLLVRWPWWPFVPRQLGGQINHPFLRFSASGELLFIMLCVTGIMNEGWILWSWVYVPLTSNPQLTPELYQPWFSLLTFGFLTFVRVSVHIWDEYFVT